MCIQLELVTLKNHPSHGPSQVLPGLPALPNAESLVPHTSKCAPNVSPATACRFCLASYLTLPFRPAPLEGSLIPTLEVSRTRICIAKFPTSELCNHNLSCCPLEGSLIPRLDVGAGLQRPWSVCKLCKMLCSVLAVLSTSHPAHRCGTSFPVRPSLSPRPPPCPSSSRCPDLLIYHNISSYITLRVSLPLRPRSAGWP